MFKVKLLLIGLMFVIGCSKNPVAPVVNNYNIQGDGSYLISLNGCPIDTILNDPGSADPIQVRVNIDRFITKLGVDSITHVYIGLKFGLDDIYTNPNKKYFIDGIAYIFKNHISVYFKNIDQPIDTTLIRNGIDQISFVFNVSKPIPLN